MKTLWLLRHAKSSWGQPSLDDSERPLNARGREAADRIGRHLREHGIRPELVLCSTAVRTRETLERVIETLGTPLDTRFEDELYLAGADALARRIARAPERVVSLMIVGHNPGLGALAVRLSLEGPADERARMRRKFPTGGLAEIVLAEWGDALEGGRLVSFVRPKRLPG